MSILRRFSRSSILITALSVSFLVFVAGYAALSDGSLEPSTRRLWAEFREAVESKRERDAYFAMVELCDRDSAFSKDEKYARWQSCSTTTAEVCATIGNCKPVPSSPHPPCISGAAVDDDSMFVLWFNCKYIDNLDAGSVKIQVNPSTGEVDYRGLAGEVKR